MRRVSIVGGSGFVGGELIRLLLFHPKVEINQVTSERFAGKSVTRVHPNLRRRTDLRFSSVSELEAVDTLFLCLPHGKSMTNLEEYRGLADQIIDLSADFRLNSPEEFESWYGEEHINPEALQDFIYGIPELHRKEMSSASYISSAGCNATATILALYPLFKRNLVKRAIVDAKVGSSEAGNSPSEGSHHPIRSGAVRSYKPTRHRHMAEMHQELGSTDIHFSATSIEMVRGVLATSQVFLNKELTEKDIWKIYREEYGEEPFIRIVKEREGSYRYPEPKILAGTNYCDIGFELDPETNRLVVISAIDNLMKGAAGQAVQAYNIMNRLEETCGLEFSGLHPI